MSPIIEDDRLMPAPKNSVELVRDRKEKLATYRRLLNRWLVRSGKDHPELASLTLACLDGKVYDRSLYLQDDDLPPVVDI